MKMWDCSANTVSYGIFREDYDNLVTEDEDVERFGLDFLKKRQYQISMTGGSNFWKDALDWNVDPNAYEND